MLIKREPGADKKMQFRIRMNKEVYDEITEYCQWAAIRYRDYFIEEACKHIFNNDEEWKKIRKTMKEDSE